MRKLRYLIVGSGYRAEYYGRLARAYPALFEALYLCRSEEKAALMRERTGAAATVSEAAAERFAPDFVVVAVNKAGLSDVAAAWAEKGYAVLSETPAGARWEQLYRLWELREKRGAKIAVCEQYLRYPELTAGLEAVRRGRIGTPQTACLSLAHDYHAASLLRGLLLAEGERFTLRGESVTSPVVETDSRAGPITDGRVAAKERIRAVVTYASGKTALYDFSSVQYRSFIRSRHLTLRGDRGEWTDNLLLWLDAENRPRRELLKPCIPEKYRVLETPELRALAREWRPELHMEQAQDEFAIATVLLDMGAYLAGGPEPYPLRYALEDAAFWLMLQEAVKEPWREVAYRPMPWSEGKFSSCAGGERVV